MAIGTPVAIGNSGNVGVATTVSLTTTAAVPAGALIIVGGSWFHATATTSITAPNTLSWPQDHVQTNGSEHVTIFSAQAPSGLASGTTITMTCSVTSNNKTLSATYVEGLATSSPVDNHGGSTGTANGWSSGNVVTANADDLLFTVCYLDFQSTNTAGGAAAELHDFQNASDQNTQTTEYEIVSSTGTKTGTGTWANAAAQTWMSALVAYKAAGGAPITDAPETLIVTHAGIR